MIPITPTVKQLLIINFLFFVGTLAVPQASDLLSLHFPKSDSFRIWQIITHMFMHGGMMHIFFNMFALYSFGSALEHLWGSKKFLFFYISCGLGAAMLQLGINYYEYNQSIELISDLNLSSETLHKVLNVKFNDGDFYRGEMFENAVRPILEEAGKWQLITEENFSYLFNTAIEIDSRMLGASGAIYGLLVAFAFMFPNAQLGLMFIPVPIKAKYFVPGLLGIDLFLGLKGASIFGAGGTGIAHFAHIGGALIGFIMMWYWKKNSFNNRRWN